MTGSVRATAALFALAAAAAPLSAQTNSFAPGAQVNSPVLTGATTIGNQMIGMELTLTLDGGATLSATWADLGGNNCGGSFSNGFLVRLSCNTDTYGGVWNMINRSSDGIQSLRMNGAPGRTVFDCGWSGTGCNNTGGGGLDGTAGSGDGYSLQTYAPATFYTGGVSGFYTNAVGISGNAPVGDLFEQLTISFDDILGAGDQYSFIADTDNSSFDAPPPTVVPEPSTYALMFSGLLGIGFMARRRRSA